MTSIRQLSTILATLGIATASTYAANGTWSNTAGGTLNWDDSANWSSGTIADLADFTASFTANLAADLTVNLNNPKTIGNITFTDTTSNNNDMVISGANTLTLDRTDATKPTINVTQSGRLLTISSVIAGTDGLLKSGPGDLLLSNNSNNYTGGTVINGGRLRFNQDSNLGNTSGGISFTGTGALLLNTGTSFTLASTRTISISGGATAIIGDTNINNNPVTHTIDGQITGAGGLQLGHYQLGSGIANLNSTSNDFTGALRLGTSNDYTFTYSSYTANVASLADGVGNGNIIFGRGNGSSSNVATFAWSANATGPLTMNNRRIELDTTVEQSVLANNNATAANTVTVNTDLLVSRAGNKTFTLSGTNTGNNTFAGIIADSVTPSAVISLSKTGSGKWIVSNANTYSGTTLVGNGTLSINSIGNVGGGASAIGNPSSVANGRIQLGNANTNGTLEYTGAAASSDRTIQINSQVGTNTGGGLILNNGSGALTFTASTFNATYTNNNAVTRNLTVGGTNGGEIQGVIQNNSALNLVSVTKSNTGTWRLSNAASTYTGATTINAGVLEVAKLADGGVASSIGQSTNINTNLNLASGATLRYVGAGDSTDRIFRLTGSEAGNNGIIDASGTGAINFTNTVAVTNQTNNISYFLQLTGTNTNDNTFAANIGNNGSGARNITKNGIGKWVLTGDTSYTGATNVNAGTLALGGSGDVNSSSGVNVAAGATFLQNSSVAIDRTITLNGTGTGAGQRAVLGGTGTISAAVVLDNLGDTLSPGNSPGVLPFAVAQTWASYSYDWEVNNWTGTTAGTDFDQIAITGSLNLSAVDPGSYVLNLLSLTGGNVSGNVPNFAETNQSWTILTTTTGITGFAVSEWTINPAGFTNNETGTWSISQSGNNLVLNYEVIPEPGTLILLGLGTALIAYPRRKRVAAA